METSRFSDLIKQYMGGIVMNFESRYNGTNDAEPKPYYYDRWFPREYSASGDFSSVETDNSVPMAYVIDYDSPLPLIKGQAIKIYNGEIPKIGVEIQSTEKKLTELNNLLLRGDKVGETQAIRILFTPLKKVYLAQKERLEWMALQLLSKGSAETTPLVNTGTNVLIESNVPAKNLYNPTIIWGQTGYTPLSDLEKIKTDAMERDGNNINKFLIDRASFNLIRLSAEAKNLFNPLAAANIPGLNLDQLNAVVSAQYGYIFEIIEKQVKIQKNGVDTTLTPWMAGQVVGVEDGALGATVWADLAESLDKKGGVDYQTAEEFILLRKYKVVHPAYGEFTSSQSRSACVLTSPSSIYRLDTTALAV